MNFDVWTTGNHSDEAKMRLNQTGLVIKAVTNKKAIDKMLDIKNLRHIIEQLGLGTGFLTKFGSCKPDYAKPQRNLFLSVTRHNILWWYM